MTILHESYIRNNTVSIDHVNAATRAASRYQSQVCLHKRAHCLIATRSKARFREYHSKCQLFRSIEDKHNVATKDTASLIQLS